jgi:hypothetical protein
LTALVSVVTEKESFRMAKLSILLFSIAISANYTNATLFGLQSSDNRLSVFTSRTAAPGWPLFFTVKPNIAVSGWDLPRNFTWDFYKTILDNNTLVMIHCNSFMWVFIIPFIGDAID